MSFSPVAASGGFSLTAVLRLLVAAASLIVEPGLRVCGLWVCGLSRCGSQALELRLSCSVACGMFPDQGSDLYYVTLENEDHRVKNISMINIIINHLSVSD